MTEPDDTRRDHTERHDTELRARLHRLDPLPDSVPVPSPSDPGVRQLMEQIMQTESFPSAVSTTGPQRHSSGGQAWWRNPAAAVAAVATVALLGVGGLMALNQTSSEPTIMALDGTSPTDAMAMCLQVTPENLATFPVAFAGTAIEMADGVATLEVTRWYRGGDTDRVTIAAPPAQPALIGGVDIEVGGRYLITADQGTVSSCHFSDVASPELEALYSEAFGS